MTFVAKIKGNQGILSKVDFLALVVAHSWEHLLGMIAVFGIHI